MQLDGRDPILDPLVLVIDGREYGGWTSARVTRSLQHCVTPFDIEVSERWAGQAEPWRIKPFAPCQVKAGRDLLLTGYVDEYHVTGSATSHSVKIAGRSKIQDLVDCMPDIKGGQFAGYSLAAIARAVAAPFGIDVVVETDNAEKKIPNAALERCETAWMFLERLLRLAGVLATDDEQGRLVLTNVGRSHAAGRLVHGVNILRFAGRLQSAKRFSEYIVLGQSGMGVGGGPAWGSIGAGGIYTNAPKGAVVTQMRAVATDPGVPRYRPHISLAESQMTLADMQHRAEWQKNFAFGRSVEVRVTVPGWRQPDGRLWKLNEMIAVASPWLGVDQDLLIVGVEYVIDHRTGHETNLTLGPIEGYTPDPNLTRIERKYRRRNASPSKINYTGADAEHDDDDHF